MVLKVVDDVTNNTERYNLPTQLSLLSSFVRFKHIHIADDLVSLVLRGIDTVYVT